MCLFSNSAEISATVMAYVKQKKEKELKTLRCPFAEKKYKATTKKKNDPGHGQTSWLEIFDDNRTFS